MDTKKLDDLMQRAGMIGAGAKKKAALDAKAIRQECAPQRKRLTEAEAEITELGPEIDRIVAYVTAFPWAMVPKAGCRPRFSII